MKKGMSKKKLNNKNETFADQMESNEAKHSNNIEYMDISPITTN